MKIDPHRAWAPEDGRWSRWVKPVLFNDIGDGPEDDRIPAFPLDDLEAGILAALGGEGPEASYRDAPKKDTALVIDYPGAAGTYLGLAMATHGFRPIPLYNAIPSPAGLVDHEPIIAALVAGAARVSQVPKSAPPAFLLDGARLVGTRTPRPGLFDNRSVCRSSDFPSASMLMSAGISRVFVLTPSIQEDLREVLLEWQREGISLWRLPDDDNEHLARHLRPKPIPAPFVLEGPNLLRRLVTFVFGNSLPRGRPDGLFGELIVPPSSG